MKIDPWSGFVIVRLRPEQSDADADTLIDLAKMAKLERLTSALTAAGLPDTQRTLSGVEADKIRELERKASATKFPPLHSLTAYWRIDMRQRRDKIDQLVDQLKSLPEVDSAYREYSVTDPAVDASNDQYAKDQDYLNAAPQGIGARWAWLQPNSDGAGVGFVDLERAWNLTHDDIVAHAVPLPLYGDNEQGINGVTGDHGTGVLGIVVGEDNDVGIVGIAPHVQTVRVTSHYDAASNTELNVAPAIAAAALVMNAGDVLLLEVQRGGVTGRPTEVDDYDFDAIRLAVSQDIIVVEAAGNGGFDLDAILTKPDDSGAILVGAANSTTHDRWQINGLPIASCFGARVNCYAWGELIVTAGGGDLDSGRGDKNKTYTQVFNGTSGASAIVAGAALVLQGMYKAANSGTPLTPAEMRQALLVNGTPQGQTVSGNIGVMPDLKEAVLALGLVEEDVAPAAPSNLRIVS
jgi:hypothetical protein